MSEEKVADIGNWLIDNIFYNGSVYWKLAECEIDVLGIIASLYNELYLSVNGEYYDYMFHWANKIGGNCDLNEDMFKRKED